MFTTTLALYLTCVDGEREREREREGGRTDGGRERGRVERMECPSEEEEEE